MMSHTRETRPLASEIKFLIDLSVAPRIQAWARTHLEPDPHGGGSHADEYEIATLYFDTPELDVIARRGSFARAKYRVRRYGSGERAFLERKLRRPDVLIKRRAMVPLSDLSRLEVPGGPPWDAAWFERRLAARGLRPVCQISYQRMARVRETLDGPIRLTLDRGLRALPVDTVRFSSAAGTPFGDGLVVLELKFRGMMPALFRRLVEEFALAPTAASKYRFAMAALGHGAESELAFKSESPASYA